MMEWKPEALNAALSATTDECPEGLQYVIIRGLSAMKFNHPSIESVDLIYSALDAAVKAQGLPQTDLHVLLGFEAGVEHGRAEAFEEAAAFVEGKGGVIPGVSAFARLLSRNNQPCMSGDARDRLNRLDRRAFDEATDALAAALRVLDSRTRELRGLLIDCRELIECELEQRKEGGFEEEAPYIKEPTQLIERIDAHLHAQPDVKEN